MVLSIYAMIILNNLVNTGQSNKKKTQILMKHDEQLTSHSFHKNNFKITF